MSPVPSFDNRGLIPPLLGSDETTHDRAPYQASMTELVAALGTTPWRENLLFGLLEYRALLAHHGYIDGLQFIDGSFVENVEVRESRDPGDIDVFSFLMRPAAYQQDPNLWASIGFAVWIGELMDRDKNKSRFLLDTYGIAVDQHGPLRLINETIYWYSLFSHRRVTREWKGFVRVPLNPADDAAARAMIV
ncbi:hypothetical protein A1D31_34875 [Bradyrhizobium liaoningense]|nr:hypothetical protein A1D31_34875 [Bradyrhizobium liaoningense]